MFFVALVAFSLFRYVGDPVHQMVGIETTLAEREALRVELGLKDPVYIQFGRFIGKDSSAMQPFWDWFWPRVAEIQSGHQLAFEQHVVPRRSASTESDLLITMKSASSNCLR